MILRSDPPQDIDGVRKYGIYFHDISPQFQDFLTNYTITDKASEKRFYYFIHYSKNFTLNDKLQLTGLKLNKDFYKIFGPEIFSSVYAYKFQSTEAQRLEIEQLFFMFHRLNYVTLIEYLDEGFYRWCAKHRPKSLHMLTNYHRRTEIYIHLPFIPLYDGLQLTDDGLGILTPNGPPIYHHNNDDEDHSDQPQSQVYYDPEGRVGVYSLPIQATSHAIEQNLSSCHDECPSISAIPMEVDTTSSNSSYDMCDDTINDNDELMPLSLSDEIPREQITYNNVLSLIHLSTTKILNSFSTSVNVINNVVLHAPRVMRTNQITNTTLPHALLAATFTTHDGDIAKNLGNYIQRVIKRKRLEIDWKFFKRKKYN